MHNHKVMLLLLQRLTRDNQPKSNINPIQGKRPSLILSTNLMEQCRKTRSDLCHNNKLVVPIFNSSELEDLGHFNNPTGLHSKTHQDLFHSSSFQGLRNSTDLAGK